MTPVTSPTLLDAARNYIDAGLSLVVVGRNKKPLGKWKERQTIPATIEKIERELPNPKATGIAVVCGNVSGGLLCMDFDENGFYEDWRARSGDDAEGLPVQRTGGGGYQVYLRCDEPGGNTELACVEDDSQKTGRRIAIETRGEGGYAVLPPSLHPSGNHYSWIEGDLSSVPYRKMASVNFMLDVARKLCRAPFTWQQLERANSATITSKGRTTLNGELSVIGQYNGANRIEDVLETNGYIRVSKDRFTRPGSDASPGGVYVRDGKSFHHSTNDALHDGYWHDPFSVFAHYQHGGNVVDAVKAAAAQLGIQRLHKSVQHEAPSNEDVISSPAKWRILTASQLGPCDQIEWAVEGLLAFGFITLFTGLWKCGKSTFISWMIHAIGAGEAFIAKVQKCGVLVISEEGGGLWARRRDEIGFTDEIQFLCKPFRGRPSQSEWQAFIKWIADEVQAGRFRVVIFDTISSMWPCDNENDASKVIAAMNPLHHITEAGGAVLLVHHPRKGDGTEGQASRGSGALPGFVDTILELRRSEPGNSKDTRRTLTGLGRFDETPSVLVIDLTQDGYRTVGSKSDAKQSDRLAVLAEILNGQREGTKLTVEGIRDAWDSETIPKPGLRALTYDLKHGWQQNLWQREGGGVKNDPYLYFLSCTPKTHSVQETNQDSIPARSISLGCRNRIGGDE